MAQTAKPGFEILRTRQLCWAFGLRQAAADGNGIVLAADPQTLERRQLGFRRWPLLASKLSDEVFSVLASLSRGGL
jgi:hypothetical protein